MKPKSKRIELFLKQISLSVCRLREEKGLSWEQLAVKADIDIACLKDIESGNVENDYSLDILFKIANALEITVSEIFK